MNFAPVEQQALIRKWIQRIEMKTLTKATIVIDTLKTSQVFFFTGSGSGSISVSRFLLFHTPEI